MDSNNEKEFYLKLIKAVRERQCLYEKNHYNYYNRKKRDEAWQEVATQCNRTGSDCKARWKLLRERFCKHMRRLGSYSPLDNDATDPNEWEYYREMLFLKESIIPRRSYREKDLSSSLDEPTINEVFINVNTMTEDDSCSSNSNQPKSAKRTLENYNKTASFDLTPLKIERLADTNLVDYSESERPEVNSTTLKCDTPSAVVVTDNTIDELFVKNIATLIRDLPIEIKDRFQANMYAEVFRLRAQYRNA